MAYNMYVCPDCRKVFKINGSGKKAKCPKCADSILVDTCEIEEDWKTYPIEKRNSIIDAVLDEPEIIEAVEEELPEEPNNSSSVPESTAPTKLEKDSNPYSSFFDFSDDSQTPQSKSTVDSQNNNNVGAMSEPIPSQPIITQAPTTQQNTRYAEQPHSEKEKRKVPVLGIIALSLIPIGLIIDNIPFFMVLCIASIVLGIISLVKKERLKGLAIAAISICSICFILLGANALMQAGINVDYQNAETFEADLNSGKNLEGKTVKFIVGEVHPDSLLGCNVWAGNHLNFLSSKSPGVQTGDTMIVRAKEIESMLGSWYISYDLIRVIQ